MAKKHNNRTVHRTMQGKYVDMDLLRQRHELTPAVGNLKVNARGDEIGPGGEIVRTREQVVMDQRNQPEDKPDESPLSNSELKQNTENQEQKPAEKDLEDTWDDPEFTEEEKPVGEEIQWVEDEEGNFVKKGE